MRKIAILTAMAVVLALGFGVASAAPPDKIVIKEFAKVKSAVPFDHKKHVGLEKNCQSCHHADPPGKEQKCTGCHTAKTEGKTISAKEAFHKQCKDCHVKMAKGPTKCDECHPKK